MSLYFLKLDWLKLNVTFFFEKLYFYCSWWNSSIYFVWYILLAILPLVLIYLKNGESEYYYKILISIPMTLEKGETETALYSLFSPNI